jgi:hypothetical protein
MYKALHQRSTIHSTQPHTDIKLTTNYKLHDYLNIIINITGKTAFFESFFLVMWDLWWIKWRWGRFPPSTSVSPANLHSTNFSTITITYHLGLVQ